MNHLNRGPAAPKQLGRDSNQLKYVVRLGCQAPSWVCVVNPCATVWPQECSKWAQQRWATGLSAPLLSVVHFRPLPAFLYLTSHPSSSLAGVLSAELTQQGGGPRSLTLQVRGQQREGVLGKGRLGVGK